jgi:excisionase family DNA binding protein
VQKEVAAVEETADLDEVRRQWLTVDEFCIELKISRRTFDRMRSAGTAPRCKSIGGSLRIRRDWVDAWAAEDNEETA